MPKWVGVIIPAAISGLIVLGGSLWDKVDDLAHTQTSSAEYIYRLKQAEESIKDLERKECVPLSTLYSIEYMKDN